MLPPRAGCQAARRPDPARQPRLARAPRDGLRDGLGSRPLSSNRRAGILPAPSLERERSRRTPQVALQVQVTTSSPAQRVLLRKARLPRLARCEHAAAVAHTRVRAERRVAPFLAFFFLPPQRQLLKRRRQRRSCHRASHRNTPAARGCSVVEDGFASSPYKTPTRGPFSCRRRVPQLARTRGWMTWTRGPSRRERVGLNAALDRARRSRGVRPSVGGPSRRGELNPRF